MNNIAIIGCSFGDCGKGAVAHRFSPQFDYIIRTGGGPNAGHTIYRDGKKYVHHMLPSADYRNEKIKSVLGSGMVIDPIQLLEEVSTANKDFPGVGKSIYVDPDAFLILDKHREADKIKYSHLGTTGKGVGESIVDKYSRSGKRILDILNINDPSINGLKELGVNFKFNLEMKNDFLKSNCLFEGAQSVVLGINSGIYPYVSCTDTTIGSISASGFNYIKLNKIFGIAKVYSTKSGEGPFPTEILGEKAEQIREFAKEYGATTGRKRRIGWLDLPMLRYSIAKSAITDIVLVKFDILNGWDKIPVCNKYDKEPICGNDFLTAKPSYVELDGWKDCRKDLDKVSKFIKFVEDETKTPVSHISCGVNKEDLIAMN